MPVLSHSRSMGPKAADELPVKPAGPLAQCTAEAKIQLSDVLAVSGMKQHLRLP
jgi:hypothetical protein